MNLTLEPSKGLRLKLASCQVIQTWQGGGRFWEHDFQLTIRQGALDQFLPRATEQADSVLYEHLLDGREYASESRPITRMSDIPADLLERLRDALNELKAKATNAQTDPARRRVIQAFRLPDPQKDIAAYRLYGSGTKVGLLVLWGVETEANSALTIENALLQISNPPISRKPKRLAWLWFLIAFLILLCLFLQLKSCKPGDTNAPTGQQPGRLGDTNAPTGQQPGKAGDTNAPTGQQPGKAGDTNAPTVQQPGKAGGTNAPTGQPQGKTPFNQSSRFEVFIEQSSNKPQDGRLALTLSLRAFDERGNPIQLPRIAGWIIGGALQQNEDGVTITGRSCSTKLNKGDHKIQIKTIMSDGTPKTIDAGEIEVNLKAVMTEEGAAKVKPRK